MSNLPSPEAKKRRHPVRTIIAAAAGLYLVWLVYQIAAFRKYGPSPGLARAETKASPVRAASPGLPSEPAQFVELRGAYHMHSRYSFDGKKTVEEIAAAAERAGLDFIILTDHGAPNFASFDAQRKIGRVLVIAGSEISSSRGHLVALGFNRPSGSFSQDANLAAGEVKSLGGFTVIAHPYSKISWSWGEPGDFGGIEIISLYSDIRRGWVASLLSAPLLLVNPSLALLKTLDPPTASLRKWDQLLKSDRGGGVILGFYALDAHKYFYETGLSLLNLHVPLDSPVPDDFAGASRALLDALRAGRFYNAVDAAADPAGFRFWLEGGGTAPAVLHVRTPYAFAHETRLLCDGSVVATGSGPDLVFTARGPGAYRVEVTLRARTPLRPDVPWILSNPILVRKDLP